MRHIMTQYQQQIFHPRLLYLFQFAYFYQTPINTQATCIVIRKVYTFTIKLIFESHPLAMREQEILNHIVCYFAEFYLSKTQNNSRTIKTSRTANLKNPEFNLSKTV